MRGIREGETRVDAPPPTASDEQWLDFAAVSGMFNIYALCEEAWREQDCAPTSQSGQFRRCAPSVGAMELGGSLRLTRPSSGPRRTDPFQTSR